ncbi:MAG: hypothetical protein LBG59_04965 [Candidatus Peribacteria bacterium]|jgi:hypothetical protein|nr:hypothetical protein [Candidatus Peribacteria bacterium]
MKMTKKLIVYLIGILSFLGIGMVGLSVLAANPPKFDADFASHLTDEKADIHVVKGEVNKQKSLIENIQLLISPTISGNAGIL